MMEKATCGGEVFKPIMDDAFLQRYEKYVRVATDRLQMEGKPMKVWGRGREGGGGRGRGRGREREGEKGRERYDKYVRVATDRLQFEGKPIKVCVGERERGREREGERGRERRGEREREGGRERYDKYLKVATERLPMERGERGEGGGWRRLVRVASGEW